jgi:hypothetical protein
MALVDATLNAANASFTLINTFCSSETNNYVSNVFIHVESLTPIAPSVFTDTYNANVTDPPSFPCK